MASQKLHLVDYFYKDVDLGPPSPISIIPLDMLDVDVEFSIWPLVCIR